MRTSDKIDELAKALAKAQAKIKHASKDNVNPHFKSRYADLASCMEAIREPFAENGLAISQPLSNEENKVKCTTILMHESGQWLASDMLMTPVNNLPQTVGGCVTYLRRYMVLSISGVAPDDDDGNAASGKDSKDDGKDKNENNNSTASGKNIATKTTQPTVASSQVQTTGNNPPSSQVVKWSKHNAGHQKKVIEFLKYKKQENMLPQLINLLDGQPANQQTLDDTWRKIDPEAPDRDPAEDEK
jgi:hypothetical protein